MANVLYSALFVENPNKLKSMFPPVHPNLFYHHSTIAFKPANDIGIEVGKKIQLQIIGRITTDMVDALLVANPKSKNKYPHITLSTAAGVKPVKSNDAFETHPELIKKFDTPVYIEVVEGYVDNNNQEIK